MLPGQSHHREDQKMKCVSTHPVSGVSDKSRKYRERQRYSPIPPVRSRERGADTPWGTDLDEAHSNFGVSHSEYVHDARVLEVHAMEIVVE